MPPLSRAGANQTLYLRMEKLPLSMRQTNVHKTTNH
jgi:hypothetical protein